MSLKVKTIKKEFFSLKARKLKKRVFRKKFIIQINSFNQLKYNLLVQFIFNNQLAINRKILSQFLIEESLINFSFQKWLLQYYKKKY